MDPRGNPIPEASMMQSVKEREQTARRFVEMPITTAYSQNSAMTSHNVKPARLEPADLNDIVEETKWLLPLYGKGNLELILSLAEEKLPVLVDRSLIKEVLVDLVANITEDAPGGATLTLKTKRVEFDSPHSGGCVHFSLSNRGNGTGKRIHNGLGPSCGAKVCSMSVGVGLSRVYRIVKLQHSGDIRVDAGLGDSSTVNIFLPMLRKDSGGTSVYPSSCF
jgi:nitrogen fixation/metabolism regulation signal transduction histidine kinase